MRSELRATESAASAAERIGGPAPPTRPVARLLRHLAGDLFGCLIIGAVLTLVLTPFITSGPPYRWLASFVFNTTISLCIGFSVSLGLRLGLPPLQRRFPSRAANVVHHIVLAIPSTAVGAELAVRTIEALGGMRAGDLRFDVLRIGFVVVGIILAIDLTYERLRHRARRDELRAQEARREALRAQLRALQARTNPHFLFNSLNTAAGLIEEDPEAAERVLEKLSGLFRYTLRGTEVRWVPLREEVAAVESYLEVESVRLGERLRTELSIAPETEAILIPPLVVQPLVENAVLHAVGPRPAGGRIRLAAERRDSRLLLRVEDDGDGLGSSPHRGSGTSLAELEERLELVYGGSAELTTAASELGGLEVRLTLPLEEKP